MLFIGKHFLQVIDLSQDHFLIEHIALAFAVEAATFMSREDCGAQYINDNYTHKYRYTNV